MSAHSYEQKQRTTDVDTQQNVTFEDMHLSPPVLLGLTKAGFLKPSPIQLQAIPIGKCGKDLVIQSKSGTGKTLVFGIIALESVETQISTVQVLILAPTREIALQNAHVILTLRSELPDLNVQVFVGGLSLEADQKKCKSCHIAVGSPGRVRQLIDNGWLKTKTIRLFILDEADKLMEDSFLDDVTWIFSQLPMTKQVMAVSATYPEVLANMVSRYMQKPTFIRLGQMQPTLVGVKQFVYQVPYHPMSQQQAKNKLDALLHLLNSIEFGQCIIFTNLQTRAKSLAGDLSRHGHAAHSMSASQSQTERLQILLKLRQYQCKVLVATDLAARGIDAEHVDLVIQMDVTRDPATYLHRVGRAGRFGAAGLAICIACEGDELTQLRTIVTQTKASVRILNKEDVSPRKDQSDAEVEVQKSTLSVQYMDSIWLNLPELEGTGLEGVGTTDSLLADIDLSANLKDNVRALLPRANQKKRKDVKVKQRSSVNQSVEESFSKLSVNDGEANELVGLTNGSAQAATSCTSQAWQEWYDSWRTYISWNKWFIHQQEYLNALRENVSTYGVNT